MVTLGGLKPFGVFLLACTFACTLLFAAPNTFAATPKLHPLTPKRVDFATFADRLQQDTCRALYGDLADDPGWSCMQQDLLSAYRTDDSEHRADLALCREQGGVLTERIPACTEAMARYITLSSQYDVEGSLDPLMEAFAAVSSRCWGQWLCIE